MPESPHASSGPARGGPRIVAIANQKGGVGKTTTAINLAAALAERGKRVLLLDLDPQGNASTGLGIPQDQRERNARDLILGSATLREAARRTGVANLDIVPATTELSSTDLDLADEKRRVFMLRDALQAGAAQSGSESPGGPGGESWDLVFVDCPPTLNLLTINALVAADSVLVPLQSEYYALEGLSQLLLTLREVRQSANPRLRMEGVVLTMFDARNRLSKEVEDDVRENLGEMVYKARIPRNVRLSEAPSFAKPILTYDPGSLGALAYRMLADEFASRIEIGKAGGEPGGREIGQ